MTECSGLSRLAAAAAGTAADAMAQQPLPELSLEELMGMDAGRVFGASERHPAGDRGAGVGLVHHRRRDRALRLSHARRHPARRARHVRDRRSQLQLSSARAGLRSRATTTAGSCCWSTDTASTTTSSDRPRSARSSASTRRCSSASRSSADRRRRSTATARSSPSST